MKPTKIVVLSTLLLSLAITTQAQKKKSTEGSVKEEARKTDQGNTTPLEPATEPAIILRLPLSKLNLIIYSVRYTQVMTAKDANELADLLINQANDTTLNRPILQKPAQRP